MGSCGSTSKPPKSERKKSSIKDRAMASDDYTMKSSTVTMTKHIKISQTVQSARSSTSSVTSQTIRASGPGASPSTSMSPLTYTPVYKRPTLAISNDATPIRPVSKLINKFEMPQYITTTSKPPARHDDVYDLSKKAYVLVFHHHKFRDSKHDRHGSFKDMQKIEQIFRNYRCDRLDINENLTFREVRSKMEQISQKDFSKYSCLIVFIMSHGGVNDTILAHDGTMYSFQNDIVEQCTVNRTLNDKPKIFVLQACRGDARIVADATRSMSHKIDIVAFQSSYQGAVSYRNIDEGSFFMQAFLRLLHENNQQSIININTLLNREFKESNILQTPTLMTTLQKELIFGKLLR